MKKIKLLYAFIFLLPLHSYANEHEYKQQQQSFQEKKDLLEMKKKGIKYKIDIPKPHLPPGEKDAELLQARNKLIFLKEQASIAQREYDSLILERRKDNIKKIKEDMIKYSININDLY